MVKRTFLVFIILTLLTGCWDEQQFKNTKLILSMGFDKGEDDQIVETVSIASVEKGGQGPVEENIQVMSTGAMNVTEGRNKIDYTIPQLFDPSKVKVVLIGKELAKNDIYQVLDRFYREPRSNLNATLALADNSAQEVLSFKSDEFERVSKFIGGILEGAVTSTHSPKDNLQLICEELFEPGVDFALPIIKEDRENNVLKFDGLALFHGNHYTEKDIAPEDSQLLMLLLDKKGKVARMTIKLADEEDGKGNISINVMKEKRDIQLKEKNGELSAVINLSLKVRIIEYPKNHLSEKKTIEKLNEKLSEVITKDAEKIIEQLQEANSDVFSLGRRTHAYHPDFYKKVDWAEYFPTMKITPKVKVDIQQYGVVN
ncbi:Ger(x)C family spore germination protein [Halobacillus yeomjeoni]|uniref:Ger(X)C family spore germination protein n=1 Tax=Halobacillus yeomjeoni TaxID=311194 RepID=A0A931HS12_9BACI|nr:Ger(x)C family spore germination protein [Halobacillus yeomjeoni]MBH0228624.1 Ger(x)C family spore germination protein [Halobacillus yeomjeoni]